MYRKSQSYFCIVLLHLQVVIMSLFVYMIEGFSDEGSSIFVATWLESMISSPNVFVETYDDVLSSQLKRGFSSDIDVIGQVVRGLASSGTYPRCDLSELFRMAAAEAHQSIALNRRLRMVIFILKFFTIRKFSVVTEFYLLVFFLTSRWSLMR